MRGSVLAQVPSSEAPMSVAQAEALFASLLADELDDGEVIALLTGLAERGESEEEILGCVRAMLRRVEIIDCGDLRAIDIGGTGGDRLNTFNISTTAAFVVAAAGVPVLKHGNRGFSSRSGSADMIEALGIRLPSSGETRAVSQCLEAIGLAYLFTPTHHRFPPRLNELRRKLRIRTIFNLAGPMAHPARLSAQLIGVADAALLPLFTNVLAQIGRRAAWVVHGHDGSDEISITGPTAIMSLRDGKSRLMELMPEDFGVVRSDLADIVGGDAHDNAEICKRILAGEEGAKSDAVIACAASALLLAGATDTLRDGVSLAFEAIHTGRAETILQRLREASHDLAD